jgi:hypothetical protein
VCRTIPVVVVLLVLVVVVGGGGRWRWRRLLKANQPIPFALSCSVNCVLSQPFQGSITTTRITRTITITTTRMR